MSFTVEFRNHLPRQVRVKSIRFGNTPPIALNNARGLDLAPDGQSGSTQSALFSDTGSRVFIFWAVDTGEVLAMRDEFLGSDFDVFVSLQGDPQGGPPLIAVGAING